MANSFVKHPIQLKGLVVKELFFRANSNDENENEETGNFQLGIGHSEYDSDLREIDVGVIIKIGSPDLTDGGDSNAPFDIKVHLLAKFSVDENRFPVDQIEHWAENNAPLVLYPYVREHVHGLSVRGGIRKIYLPLMEVPTLKFEK